MPPIHFVTDINRSFFNFIIENKPRLKEILNSLALNEIDSELYRRIMVDDVTDSDSVVLVSLKNDFMHIYEQEMSTTVESFTEGTEHFIQEFENFSESRKPQLEKYFAMVHSFFGFYNDSYLVEVILSPVPESNGKFTHKKLPCAFSGRSTKNSVVLFPFDQSKSDFDERIKILFHELCHVVDYQHTTSSQTKSKLHLLSEKNVRCIRSKISIAKSMRDLDIIKILYEIVVNTLSHKRFGIFQETVLDDTTLHGDRNWIETFKFDSTKHKIGDLQMAAAWKVLPYMREYFKNKKEVDEALFDVVAQKVLECI